VAPLKQRGSYLLIVLQQSVRAYKNKKVTNFSLRNSVPYPGDSSPFYSLPFATAFHHDNLIIIESILNRKIFCSRADSHGAATEQNLSSRECIK